MANLGKVLRREEEGYTLQVPNDFWAEDGLETIQFDAFNGPAALSKNLADDFTLRRLCRLIAVEKMVTECSLALARANIDFIKKNSMNLRATERRALARWLARERNLISLKRRISEVEKKVREQIDIIWARDAYTARIAKQVFLDLLPPKNEEEVRSFMDPYGEGTGDMPVV